MPALDRKWWTLIAVCTATFMLLLDITVVNVALPDIQRSLHASFSDLQWVIDAYSLTLAAFLLTAGVIGDMFGRREVFAIGLGVFSASSLVCGLSTSSLMLNLARAAQGVGGAIMFATSLALIAQAFSGRERGTAFGIYGAVIGGAVAVGPLVGGAITSGIGWRWIFFVNVPIGVLAIFVTLTRIQESRDPNTRRVDWIGFVSFSGALFMLVFALVRGNDDGWGSTLIIGLLVGAVLLLVVFLVAEWRQADPMLDLTLFKRPAMVGVSLAAFTIAASIFALFLYLTLYIQDDLGYGPLAAGVRFLPITMLAFIVAPFAGKLTVRIQARYLLGTGLFLIAVGCLLMATTHASSGWTVLLPGIHRRRHRDRDGQPGAGLVGHLGGAAAAQRDGLGGQQHLPPGRHRHRHRRAGHGVPDPDRKHGPWPRCGQTAGRAGGGGPRGRRPAGRPGRGRRARGVAVDPVGRGARRPARGLPGRVFGHPRPPDGHRRGHRLHRLGRFLRPGAPARLRTQLCAAPAADPSLRSGGRPSSRPVHAMTGAHDRPAQRTEGPGTRDPGRPRDQRASSAITDAALRQLADVGYARVSMESVAIEAGVARATIYRRYRDKADLITAAIAANSSTHLVPDRQPIPVPISSTI